MSSTSFAGHVILAIIASGLQNGKQSFIHSCIAFELVESKSETMRRGLSFLLELRIENAELRMDTYAFCFEFLIMVVMIAIISLHSWIKSAIRFGLMITSASNSLSQKCVSRASFKAILHL